MKKNHWLVLGVLFGALLGAPGCISGEEEPEYQYSRTDVMKLVGGEWKGTLSVEGSAPTTYTLLIEDVPPGVKPACGNHELSAPLCIDSASLALTGTLTTADKAFEGTKLDGSFEVYGLELTNGQIQLRRGDEVEILTSYQNGNFDDAYFTNNGQKGTMTFKR